MKVLLPIVLSMALAPTAGACAICVGKPLKFAFQDSEYFFVGKVTRQQNWTVTFEVLEQFKGDVINEVTLQTSSSCSMSKFEQGATYLVEATTDRDGLVANLCSHTARLDSPSAQRELEVVKARTSWWSSCLGRVSLYRFRHFLARRLAQ